MKALAKAASPKSFKVRSTSLEQLPTAAFGKLPIRHFAADCQQTIVAPYLQQLIQELRQAGLQYFTPTFYFGDEWFAPEGLPAIAIPIYLAHPRLTEMSLRLGKKIEGHQPDACMKLLRHECGHVFDHAFACSRTRIWQQLFGNPRKAYRTQKYRFQPQHPDFVDYLGDGYGQSHPDEDFAETFAAVLDPESGWKTKYAHSPFVFKKLTYVALLIKQNSKRALPPIAEPLPFAAARMRRSVANYCQSLP